MLAKFDLNLLLVFQTLMEERSVTRAGNRLGKTQSAVSNALKRLREGLDDPLFVRSPEGLMPTPRAEGLAPEVAQLLALAENCLRRDEPFDPAVAAARFAIGAPDRLSLPVLLPFLEMLRLAAPSVSVDVRTADRDHAVELLRAGDIDLALGWFDRLPPDITCSEAFSEALVCLVRRGHPIAVGAEEVTLDRVLAFPHIVVTSGGDRKAAFDMILAGMGRKRNMRISLSNFTMVRGLLQDSDLIGVFTQRTATYFADHYGLRTLPLPLDIAPISHKLIWHRRLDADRMHAWLRRQLLHCCATGPGTAVSPLAAEARG